MKLRKLMIGAICLVSFGVNASVITTFTESDWDTLPVVTVLEGAPKTNDYFVRESNDELLITMPLEFDGSALSLFSFIFDPKLYNDVGFIDVALNAGVLRGNAGVGVALFQGNTLFNRTGNDPGSLVTTSDDFDLFYSFSESDGLDFSDGADEISIGFWVRASLATFDVEYRADDLVAVVKTKEVSNPSVFLLFLIIIGVVFKKEKQSLRLCG